MKFVIIMKKGQLLSHFCNKMPNIKEKIFTLTCVFQSSHLTLLVQELSFLGTCGMAKQFIPQ